MISVSDGTPVRQNSRASLQSMGLTGGSGIQITPGTPDLPFLVATAEDPVPTIKADPGGGQGLFDAAPAVMNNANALLTRLNDLVAENQELIPHDRHQCGAGYLDVSCQEGRDRARHQRREGWRQQFQDPL